MRLFDPFKDYGQIISLSAPAVEEVAEPALAAELARLGNDEQAELVRRHAGRFLAFVASVPMNNIDAACREVQRAVRDLGAVGIQLYTDAAGNTGSSAAFPFSVNVTGPIVTLTSIGGSGAFVSGQSGYNSLVGTASPNRSVSILSGATTLGSTSSDGDGNFSYTLTNANLNSLGEGSGKTISASQTDLAGNTGTSTPFSFTVDRTPQIGRAHV